MTLSTHALSRLSQRTSLSADEFVLRLTRLGILERVEKGGARHYVIWLPEEGEFFCAVVDNDVLVTLMPLIWRAKQISDEILQQAREAAESL